MSSAGLAFALSGSSRQPVALQDLQNAYLTSPSPVSILLDDATRQNHPGEIPHQAIKLPNCLHGRDGAGEEFLEKPAEAMK